MNLIFLLLFSLLFSTSCSFKSDDEQVSEAVSDTLDINEMPNADFDGDKVTNAAEIARGTNPLRADIPRLNTQFLQNYRIVVSYESIEDQSLGEFSIDTSKHFNDPDFSYRVGELFIRTSGLRESARIGKFENHSVGIIKEYDLTRVSYPEVDPRVYVKEVLKYNKHLDESKYKINNIQITLENSARLMEAQGFEQIKDLSVNFYYYDYEKESYELIKTHQEARNFSQGVNETYEVIINNVPVNFLRDNFFKKGEFIVSEVDDYKILSMKTTYKSLLASVKAVSIPVALNTFEGTEVVYVGANGGKVSFNKLLSSLFGNDFEISDNKLTKVRDFTTNLSSYDHLKDLKAEDKKGKWFIFTNKLTRSYLNHLYSPKDSVSLTYALGSELASQKDQSISSFQSAANSVESDRDYPLGELSPNSSLHLQVAPQRLWGETKRTKHDVIESDGRCGNNCFTGVFRCVLDFHFFDAVDQALNLQDDQFDILNRLILVINNTEYSLKSLKTNEAVSIKYLDDNYHISISDLSLVHPLPFSAGNKVSLKLVSNREVTFSGLRVTRATGPNYDACMVNAPHVAKQFGIPVSNQSQEFSAWSQLPGRQGVAVSGEHISELNFSISFKSIITNMFN
jgi:hypothetical protein